MRLELSNAILFLIERFIISFYLILIIKGHLCYIEEVSQLAAEVIRTIIS